MAQQETKVNGTEFRRGWRIWQPVKRVVRPYGFASYCLGYLVSSCNLQLFIATIKVVLNSQKIQYFIASQNIWGSNSTSSEIMYKEEQLSFNIYPQMSKLRTFSRKSLMKGKFVFFRQVGSGEGHSPR